MIAEKALRNLYQKHGVQQYYEQYGHNYANPHEAVVQQLLTLAVSDLKPNLSKVFDLACGSGEVSRQLIKLGVSKFNIVACDPYTALGYQKQTLLSCHSWSFNDIAAETCVEAYYFSLTICSFALHLCETSRLPRLCQVLSTKTPELWVITPNKQPQIKSDFGFKLQAELITQRIRLRAYTSLNYNQG